MENSIYIKDENGNEVKMNILFTFDHEDNSYCIVYADGQEDELYPFKYDEEGHLTMVEDEEELAIIQEVLEAFDDEEE